MKVETVELEIERLLLLSVRVKGSITDVEYVRWLERYRAIHVAVHEKNMQLAVLYDLSDAPPLSADQRRMQAEWNDDMDELLHSLTIAIAFVTKSAIMRGIMTAIFWFNRPKSPHQTFSTPVEGLDWLLDYCEKRGHAISPDVRVLAHQRLLPPAPIASVG